MTLELNNEQTADLIRLCGEGAERADAAGESSEAQRYRILHDMLKVTDAVILYQGSKVRPEEHQTHERR